MVERIDSEGRTSHPPSYAEAKKMKLLMFYTMAALELAEGTALFFMFFLLGLSIYVEDV